MAAEFSSLPDHIIEQILVKIPCTKSILTCTSVCKSWHALIKSPQFVNFHLSNSYSDDKIEYFLCCYKRFYPLAPSYLIPDYCIQYNSNGELRTYRDLKFLRGKKIIGVINGLICYAGYAGDGICIWNPAIRKLKILPKSRFYKKASSYGFWFDVDGTDYKVAKINYKVRCNVEVYSLRTNSWDLVAIGGPNLGDYDGENVINVINGTMHLLILGKNGWTIISFDVKNRMFKETVIWQDEKWEESIFDLVVTESQRGSLIVLRHERIGCFDLDPFCCLRVYDEGLNQLYKIELEGTEKFYSLIGVGSINTSKIVFQKTVFKEYWAGSKLLVCDVEDLSDYEAFKLEHFSCVGGNVYGISLIQPFTETLVLLHD